MRLARTYLDWNASAPLRSEARAAMLDVLDLVGNPSSVHAEGRRLRGIVEAAREQVAALAGARPSEVVFTSGATEANVWALSRWPRVLAPGIEHGSVLAPAKAASVFSALPVTAEGVVDLEALKAGLAEAAAADDNTLVSLQLANNETGAVQPVGEAASLVHEHGFRLHTDAVQACGRVAVDFHGLGADLMSLSSHKMGGPMGVGALIIRDGLNRPPLLPGGGQERRRRAGTENVAGIAGFGAAAEAARDGLNDMPRIARLRDALEREVMRLTPNAIVVSRDAPRLGNTSCIALAGARAETMVIRLDLAGIAVSSGAACSSGKVGSSHVLAAMGLAPSVAEGAIRVSLGPETTENDIAAFTTAWAAVATRAAVEA